LLNILRLLLYERIWGWDRYLYALSIFEPTELVKMGYNEPYARGTIVGIQENRVQVRIEQEFSSLMNKIRDARTLHLIPEPYDFILGPRYRCTVLPASEDTLTLEVATSMNGTIPQGQVLLTVSQRTFITQTPPISKIILEKRSRTLGKLSRIGTSERLSYWMRGALRLIDALTGFADFTSMSPIDASRWRNELVSALQHYMHVISRVRRVIRQ